MNQHGNDNNKRRTRPYLLKDLQPRLMLPNDGLPPSETMKTQAKDSIGCVTLAEAMGM